MPQPEELIGRAPESLSVGEQLALAGKWIALAVYSPAKLPPHRIEAVANSVEECIRQIRTRGLDPRDYEFTLSPAAF